MARTLAHRAWRKIPHSWRVRFFDEVTPLVAPQASRHPKGGVPIGIADGSVRPAASAKAQGSAIARSLETSGLQPTAYDLSAAFAQNDLPGALRDPPAGARHRWKSHRLAYQRAVYALRHVHAPDDVRSPDGASSGIERGNYRVCRMHGGPLLSFVHEVWVPSRFRAGCRCRAPTCPATCRSASVARYLKLRPRAGRVSASLRRRSSSSTRFRHRVELHPQESGCSDQRLPARLPRRSQ